jgi:hypothetical protein
MTFDVEKAKIQQKIKICEALILEHESRNDPYKAIATLKEDIEICKLALKAIELVESKLIEALRRVQGITAQDTNHFDAVEKLRKIHGIVNNALDRFGSIYE